VAESAAKCLSRARRERESEDSTFIDGAFVKLIAPPNCRALLQDKRIGRNAIPIGELCRGQCLNRLLNAQDARVLKVEATEKLTLSSLFSRRAHPVKSEGMIARFGVSDRNVLSDGNEVGQDHPILQIRGVLNRIGAGKCFSVER